MNLITYIFYGMLTILVLRLAGFGFLSFIYTMSHGIMRFRKKKIKNYKISIIVPAYNEELTIAGSIKSMLNLDYPNYEVIVIDDGSTDNTFKQASKFSEKIKLIKQENKGKPGAINTGIGKATGDIIITVDADSKLTQDALKWVARRFSGNPKLGAVAGNVKIHNPKSFLRILQSLEYTMAINLGRKSQSVLRCVMIVPGAIAAIRSDVLKKIGNFSTDTFAEDFDITMKILHAGYQVEYESHAIALTQAPDSVEDIIKQRRRWTRGMIQVLSKYEDMYLNPEYGLTGILGVPYMWFEMSSSLLNMMLMFTLFINAYINGIEPSFTIGILTYWSIMIIVSLYALLIEPLINIREIIASPLSIFYNTFIDGINIMAFVEETMNIVMKWEKPKREQL